MFYTLAKSQGSKTSDAVLDALQLQYIVITKVLVSAYTSCFSVVTLTAIYSYMPHSSAVKAAGVICSLCDAIKPAQDSTSQTGIDEGHIMMQWLLLLFSFRSFHEQ